MLSRRPPIHGTDSSPDSKSATSLRIVTAISINDQEIQDLSWLSPSSSSSSTNSLFDEIPPAAIRTRASSDFPERNAVASRQAPPIQGLFAPSVLLPVEIADEVVQHCMEKYFSNGANQVMLFGRALPSTGPSEPGVQALGLPLFMTVLLSSLCELLRPEIPPETHTLLFPPPDAPIRSRQAILNLYQPGEGITPHIDLLRRFGDGIIGVSFGSSCTMSFRRAAGTEDDASDDGECHLHLPERSIIVLSGDARYVWTHGIQGRAGDFVRDEQSSETRWIERGTRMSITFRWLLPGADVVGDDE
ncbi:hypothetical protein HWV62_32183 [Athelia sp. TMB]|nr:hypothetical protein HWV62_32183 [Athelia sp. TMB]